MSNEIPKPWKEFELAFTFPDIESPNNEKFKRVIDKSTLRAIIFSSLVILLLIATLIAIIVSTYYNWSFINAIADEYAIVLVYVSLLTMLGIGISNQIRNIIDLSKILIRLKYVGETNNAR